LPFGIYSRFGVNIINENTDEQLKILNNFQAILGLMGYEQELEQSEELVGSVEISIQGIGIEISGNKLKYKCILVLKPFHVSCQFGKIIFTALMVTITQKAIWVVNKVNKFMGKVGQKILEFAADTKEFAAKSVKAIS
jgi:hypothetical protein